MESIPSHDSAVFRRKTSIISLLFGLCRIRCHFHVPDMLIISLPLFFFFLPVGFVCTFRYESVQPAGVDPLP